jgi:GxxExxY protein
MNRDNHEEHEEYEGHEGDDRHKRDEATQESRSKLPEFRLPSPLSTEAELVMTQTIGCAIAVHQALGPGFIESIYRKAMCVELESRNLAYEEERPIRVCYRGVEIPGQRIDLIIEGEIIVELKAVTRLDQVHKAQLISYLKTTGLRGGLLINFRVPLLKDGIRRVVV